VLPWNVPSENGWNHKNSQLEYSVCGSKFESRAFRIRNKMPPPQCLFHIKIMNVSHKTDTKHYHNKQIQKSGATSAWTLLRDSYLRINTKILSPRLVMLLNVHMSDERQATYQMAHPSVYNFPSLIYQGCTNPGRHINCATTFCMVVPNICGSSV